MIPIAKPLIGKEELDKVKEVLESGMLAQGKVVEEFEQQFAQYIGTEHAIATSNGTTALHAALLALGVGPGDEVIVPTFTFFASASAVMMTGAKPVLVDVDYETFNIDIEKIKETITPKTKVIEPVHLYGLSCDMNALQDIANDKNLLLLEDACQAHGAEYNGKRVGSFGTAACFSFYPTKNMTTGEGGIITTNDRKIAEKARILISHGQEGRYNHTMLGYNYRMTNVHAAIGVAQLHRLAEFNNARIKHARLLNQGLKDVKGIITPSTPAGRMHVFHQYTIKVTDDFSLTRNELVDHLNKQGVGTGIYYGTPLHKQVALRSIVNEQYPVADRLASQVLSLPVHPSLTENDIEKILTAIKSA